MLPGRDDLDSPFPRPGQELRGNARRGERDHFQVEPARKVRGRLRHRRPMPSNLRRPAAGQEKKAPAGLRRQRRRLGETFANLVHQGMSRPHGVGAQPAVDVHLERKQRDDAARAARDRLRPTPAPRPHLRADVVDERHPVPLEPPRQERVEVRKVDQDGSVRPPPARLATEGGQRPDERGKLLEDLEDSDDREILGADGRIHPLGREKGAAHSERPNVGTPRRDRPQEAGAVNVSGGLARGNEKIQANRD